MDESSESWDTRENTNFSKQDSLSSREKKELLRYPEEDTSKSSHRKARLLGRLAILAGLDGFPYPFKSQSGQSPGNRISPFFAAYYDPFPAIPPVFPAFGAVTPTVQTDGPSTPELDQVIKRKFLVSSQRANKILVFQQDFSPTEETSTQSEESESTEEDYSSSSPDESNSLSESESSESTESSESQEEADNRTEEHKHKVIKAFLLLVFT